MNNKEKERFVFIIINTARFGEIVEVDGCFDYWIDDNKFCIYAAVDKATGKMLSIYAEEQETTAGYAKLLTKLFQNYGVPEIIRSDNRISFYSAGRNGTPLDYCLEKLGCKVTSSSIATYKPNVERSFKTLQNNLPLFLKLNNIKTIQEFNDNADLIINMFNSIVKRKDEPKISFFKKISEETIKSAFSYVKEAKVLSGNVVKINNKYYAPFNSEGKRIFMLQNGKVLVHKKIDSSTQNEFYIKSGLTKYLLQVIDRDINFEVQNKEDDFYQKELEKKNKTIANLRYEIAVSKQLFIKLRDKDKNLSNK